MWYNYPTIFDKLNLFYLRASYGCDSGHFMASSGNHCPSWKCVILASGNGHEMEKGKIIHFQGPLAKFARKPWPLFFCRVNCQAGCSLPLFYVWNLTLRRSESCIELAGNLSTSIHLDKNRAKYDNSPILTYIYMHYITVYTIYYVLCII